MINSGRFQTRGQKFFSSMIGEAQNGYKHQILNPNLVEQLAPARRNVRSRLIAHEFNLLAGQTQEFLHIAIDGWALSIIGINTDHDGGNIPAPLFQIEFPNTNHPPMGWSQAGETAYIGSSLIASQAHGQILEEPGDYFRMIAPTESIQINAKRHPTDMAGNRRFSVVLECVEIARSW
ncbi:MAG: hypothetical protein M0Q24_11345 [Sulfurimonas sp.]|uniref:hypothetical protein n=1 Tax=Sulfurimonas sp. TaxID=2022749 RepID=UPI0025D38519|nr:hypothetical protein [Sulfurimonas sp.]MCK9492667.1 hypothetical protein [Sulfurimonas sp.]